MKVIEPKEYVIMEFGFDPIATSLVEFNNQISMILWSFIKRNSITDQFFGEAVVETTKQIEKRFSYVATDYDEFKHIIERSKLAPFGRKLLNGAKYQTQDDSFWLLVYNAILTPEKFDLKFEDNTMNFKELYELRSAKV